MNKNLDVFNFFTNFLKDLKEAKKFLISNLKDLELATENQVKIFITNKLENITWDEWILLRGQYDFNWQILTRLQMPDHKMAIWNDFESKFPLPINTNLSFINKNAHNYSIQEAFSMCALSDFDSINGKNVAIVLSEHYYAPTLNVAILHGQDLKVKNFLVKTKMPHFFNWILVKEQCKITSTGKCEFQTILTTAATNEEFEVVTNNEEPNLKILAPTVCPHFKKTDKNFLDDLILISKFYSTACFIKKY